LPAIPYSHGRALGCATSKHRRRSNAISNVSEARSSARAAAEAARHVAVDVGVVAVEDGGEAVGVAPRALDQHRVGRGRRLRFRLDRHPHPYFAVRSGSVRTIVAVCATPVATDTVYRVAGR
jgi:hypothetical protein